MDDLERHFPDDTRPRYQEPQPDVDRVEALRKRLYSRVEPLPKRKQVQLSPITSKVGSDWGTAPIDNQPPKKRANLFLVFFGIATLFFVAAAAYAGFVWHKRSQNADGDNVTVEIVGPVSVKGGEQVAFEFLISNQNAVEMEFVDLTLDFPSGTKTSDLSKDIRHEVIAVGTIAPGGVVKRSVEVTLFGKEQSVQEIDAVLQYRLPGSVTIFRREKNFALTLTKSPLSAVTRINKEVTSGQVLTIDVDITSNTESKIEDAMLKIDYPFGFEVLEEDGESLGEPGLFDLGAFEPGEDKSIRVTGRMTGSDGDERTFKISTGVRGKEGTAFTAVFATDLESVKITKPFLFAEMTVGDSREPVVAVNAERGIRSFITVRNNLDVDVSNVEVEISIGGDILAEEDIKVDQGFYRSSDNTLIWNKTTSKDLAQLEPGEEVRLGFAFGIKPLVEGSVIRRNPEVFTSLNVRGSRLSETNVPQEVLNSVERHIKVNSFVTLNTGTSYSTGPFTNTGPVPPEVDIPTSYTATYEILNTSNALADVVVKIPLPSGVSWQGGVSPSGSDVSIDKSTGILTWEVGDIAAGAGYTVPAKEMSIQLVLFPSITQVGNEAILAREPEIKLYDRFTAQTITFKGDRATTKLTNDTSFKNGDEDVVQ